MFEWIKKTVLCHRVMYGALGMVYLAGCVGVDKAVVCGLAAAVYGVLCLMDR